MLGRSGRSHRRLILAVLLLGVLVAAALLAGYLPRRTTTQQLDSAAAKLRNTPPIVSAAKVTRAPNLTEVSFPGSITPITEAYIYARAAGYLKRRYVDIGDRVAGGQLLAEIDAPDLDQQVTQAEAALAQAEGQLGQAEATLQQLIATRDLAAVTWQRYQVLTKTGAVSRQAGDTQNTAAKTAEANLTAGEKNVVAAKEFIRASQATLDRLITLQRYEKVTSPFAGIVTARNVDVGALISTTGSSQGPSRPNAAGPSDVPSGGEIFRVAQIGKLRVLVTLPQRGVGHPCGTVSQRQRGRTSESAISRPNHPHFERPGCHIQNTVDRGAGHQPNRSLAAWYVHHGSLRDESGRPAFSGSRRFPGGRRKRHKTGTAAAAEPDRVGESRIIGNGSGGAGPSANRALPKCA